MEWFAPRDTWTVFYADDDGIDRYVRFTSEYYAERFIESLEASGNYTAERAARD